MEKKNIKIIILMSILSLILISFISAELCSLSCSDVNLEFRNKKTGTATYSLKIKEGTGQQGSFEIYSSCSNSDFTAIPNEQTQTIVGSEIKSGSITISQSNNKDSSTTCQIKASINRLGFSAEDSCSFTVTGKSACSLESELCGTGCCEGLECREGICGKKILVEKDSPNSPKSIIIIIAGIIIIGIILILVLNKKKK